MIKELPLSAVRFVGLWVETLLYGAYTVLFCHCYYILRYGKKSATVNRPLLASSIVLFSLATGLIITDFARGYAAFIIHGGTLEGSTDYYEQFWIWSNLLRESFFTIMLSTSDAVFIYRLYVVWGFNKYIIIGPIILLLCEAAFAALATWGQSTTNPGATLQNFDFFTWGTVSFSFSFATNIVVTGLIAGRIWWYGHRASTYLGKVHKKKYHRAMVIIIESGLISALTMVLILIFYRVTLVSADFIYFPACQIMGIVPTLIIVRVGLGVSTENPTDSIESTLRFRSDISHSTDNSRQRSNGRSETVIEMSTQKSRSTRHNESADNLSFGHPSGDQALDKSFMPHYNAV
ncbi:hypothetical protein D9757_000985 [Collybiopsis confluens]|uniref:Uncharacterized protein n=1 Tax=Collybiopsis confluens TaxID=2823264 RepID=A0A8H5I0J1_9AGAR|nr:hypothetical protein D9757_000985 [Collybiopsis confluens]